MSPLKLLIALALTSVLPAHACRGPFSSAYNIHITKGMVIYAGEVLETHEKEIEYAPGFKQKAKLATLKVTHTWQKKSPETVSAILAMATGDPIHCVRHVFPEAGEKWLVVGVEDEQGVIHQISTMGFNIGADAAYEKSIMDAIGKQRGKGLIIKAPPAGKP